MTRKSVIVVVLLLVLASVSLVAAQSNLPGSGWKSGQNIQNIGSGAAQIVFTAYNQTGQEFDCGNKTAQEGEAVNFLTDVDCQGVPAGFVGSAVVSADQPIAAIVNVNNRGTGAAAGQYRGTDGSDVATNISFPLVKNNYFGRTTTFYVQNASSSPNNIAATFNTAAGSFNRTFNNVPANAMVVISPADAGVPTGQTSLGALIVTGSQPMAGSALEHEAAAAVAQNLQATKAFTPDDYDDVAYCPLIRNDHTANGQTTGLQVLNAGGAAQTITVEYSYTQNGTLQSKTLTKGPVAPNASVNFFGAEDLPAGVFGSATVTGDGGGNIAITVNDRGFKSVNPNRVTAYSCFAANSATNTSLLPQYKELFGGNTTGLQIQNVAESGSANCTITYRGQTNAGVKSEVTFENNDPIPAGSFLNLFNVSQAQANVTRTSGDAIGTLFNTFGGVVVTCDQPVVTQANESSFGAGASGQDTKNYEGFNQ
jgi:hypothetical protein